MIYGGHLICRHVLSDVVMLIIDGLASDSFE